jgi:hypothetical protein
MLLMSRLTTSFRVRLGSVLLLCTVALLGACEDDETSPGPVPASVEIISGDAQYTKQGTELEQPVIAQVVLSDGEPAPGVPVKFSIRSGGGSLSRTSASTNQYGQTSVRWTMGPGTGTQELTISLADDAGAFDVATATSSTFYCPEEDPTFQRRFTPENDLFLFTRKSSVIRGNGPERAGVVHLGLDLLGLEFDASTLAAFDESVFQAVVRDCAFSDNGEFFIAWQDNTGLREIAKIAPNGTATHFASLDGLLGAEITALEGGALAGCDEFGPFTVGCRDTLERYADALYSGTLPDAANDDAVAYDPVGNYLYFIYRQDRSLWRVPLNGYTQTGPTEDFLTLEPDEAAGAVGMVFHSGLLYILVESAATKSIVTVTTGGTKTTVYDFFDRGAGDLAGVQNDLALDADRNLLYTLDTLNNVVLIYVILEDRLEVIVPDATTDEGAASTPPQNDERVGLAVLP